MSNVNGVENNPTPSEASALVQERLMITKAEKAGLALTDDLPAPLKDVPQAVHPGSDGQDSGVDSEPLARWVARSFCATLAMAMAACHGIACLTNVNALPSRMACLGPLILIIMAE